MNPDFSSVTEVTGYNVTSEQISRMYARYRFAAGFCDGKDVLEVACGTGQGLGYLASCARSVVGGDCDEKIVSTAQSYYKGRLKVLKIDAHALPFDQESFVVVILYEAIYYLSDPAKFVMEAKRVLRPGGVLIICTANKDWDGFNPSPYSHRYFSATELGAMFKEAGFNTELYGNCAVGDESLKGKIVGFIKQAAVKLHLMPKTMKGKEFLKRIFHGKLKPLPAELTEDIAQYDPPVPIPGDRPEPGYKVIIAVGKKA